MIPTGNIENLVARYLETYPDFNYPPDDFDHISVLAMHEEIKLWLMGKLGGPLPYWQLMLSAAKHWFPDKNKTNLGHLFCIRLECEANTFWDGRVEFEPVMQDYLEWRKILRKSQ